MKKTSADKIKRHFNISHHYQEAYKFFAQEELNNFLKLLSDIQYALENSISDYSLEISHDLLDDKTPQIVRVFWLSKGMRDYYLCIDGTGLIRAVDPEAPDGLFDQMMSALETFY